MARTDWRNRRRTGYADSAAPRVAGGAALPSGHGEKKHQFVDGTTSLLENMN